MQYVCQCVCIYIKCTQELVDVSSQEHQIFILFESDRMIYAKLSFSLLRRLVYIYCTIHLILFSRIEFQSFVSHAATTIWIFSYMSSSRVIFLHAPPCTVRKREIRMAKKGRQGDESRRESISQKTKKIRMLSCSISILRHVLWSRVVAALHH